MDKGKVVLIATLFLIAFSCYADEPDALSPVEPAPPVKNKIGELTGDFDLTTNYMFRGLSLSNNLPAAQGGFIYTFLKTGIYFYLWGSSTSLPIDTVHNETASVEIDEIVGIKNSITKNLSYDVSMARYVYPKAPHFTWPEFLPKISYKILNLTLTPSLAYTANVFNLHKPATYYNGRVDLDIPAKYILNFNNVTASASIGRWFLPSGIGFNTYTDYMLGISKTISNYVLTLQYTNTNHKFFNNSLDGPQTVATVLVNF